MNHASSTERHLIGAAPCMEKLWNNIIKLGWINCPVLIVGESGVGKELVGRSIHENSPRRDRAFSPVDCAALSSSLFESEVFGYVRGAFTGAGSSRQGLLEAADGGTIFFDEISELAPGLQAKLLRVLQEREIKPLGTTRRLPFPARIIASTNRDLKAAVREGAFRKDLYFRLSAVTIAVPPLRERKEDIPLLAAEFLRKFAEEGQQAPQLSQEVLRSLMAYRWPGNVRELENAMQHVLAFVSGGVVHLEDLPADIRQSSQCLPVEETVRQLSTPLRELEREAILRAMEDTGGKVVPAARLLGIAKTTLYRKLKGIKSGA